MTLSIVFVCGHSIVLIFFFNDTATTEIYTLSLHDALPISCRTGGGRQGGHRRRALARRGPDAAAGVVPQASCPAVRVDRKSTRLNSSHLVISYAVFCLKKKKHSVQHR